MASTPQYRGKQIQFGSVFIKKKQPNRILKKKKKPKPNRNQFEPVGFSSVRFFRENRFGSVFSGLSRFFQFWLDFFRFGLIFSVLTWFFQFWLSFFDLARVFSIIFSIRFGFINLKPIPNRTSRFFQNINQFFFSIRFFRLFFSWFSQFFGFFTHPYHNITSLIDQVKVKINQTPI